MAVDASEGALSDKRAAVEQAWDTLDSNIDLDAGADSQSDDTTGVDKGDHPAVDAAPTGDEAHRESPSAEVQTPTDKPKTGETYNAWLARYNGDPEKGAAHSLETQTQNAQFHRENAELKARLAQLEKAPESPAQPQEQPLPERVQQLDQQMAAIASQYKAGEARLAEQQVEARKVFGEIQEIAEELDQPGPSSDVADLTWKKQRAERKLERLQAQHAQTSAQNDNLWAQYHHQLRPLREQAAEVHQMQLRLAHAAEAETQKLQAREMESVRKEFSSVAEAVAKDPTVGMPARLIQKFLGTKEKNYRDGYAIKEALAFLVPDPATGETPDIPDFKAFISARAAEFIALSKEAHSAISEDYARKKTGDAEQPGPKGKSATAPDTKRKASLEDLEDEVERRWAEA